MAQKITAMTPAGALTGAEIVPVVRAGDPDNFKTTAQDIANLAPSSEPPVISVNELTGAVVLDTDDIGEGATNLYLTQARLRTVVELASGASYALVLADASQKWKALSHTSGIAVTIPLQASVAWPANAEIPLQQAGAGALTITCPGGTLDVPAVLTNVTNGTHAVCAIKRLAEDHWVLYGNLVPA